MWISYYYFYANRNYAEKTFAKSNGICYEFHGTMPTKFHSAHFFSRLFLNQHLSDLNKQTCVNDRVVVKCKYIIKHRTNFTCLHWNCVKKNTFRRRNHWLNWSQLTLFSVSFDIGNIFSIVKTRQKCMLYLLIWGFFFDSLLECIRR